MTSTSYASLSLSLSLPSQDRQTDRQYQPCFSLTFLSFPFFPFLSFPFFQIDFQSINQSINHPYPYPYKKYIYLNIPKKKLQAPLTHIPSVAKLGKIQNRAGWAGWLTNYLSIYLSIYLSRHVGWMDKNLLTDFMV